MTATMTANRTPKGIPTGGEFATHDRSEADLTLDAPNAKRVPTEYPDAPEDGLTDAEIYEHAVRLARSASFNVGLSREDAEDIAQETVLSVLLTKSKNGGQPVQGGLIRVAARALVSRRVDTHARHEDSRAFRLWKFEVEQAEAFEGRHLNKTELDSIAEDIRENWHNPRHKPSVGFQYETKVVSSDSISTAFDNQIANIPSASILTADGSTTGHELADAVENGEVAKETAKRKLWNVLAADNDAPEALAHSIPEKQVKAYIKALSGDRAVDVAERFTSGTATAAEQAALFAPFGNLGTAGKLQVARTIVSRPAVGHRLWMSALDFANQKHAA